MSLGREQVRLVIGLGAPADVGEPALKRLVFIDASKRRLPLLPFVMSLDLELLAARLLVLPLR